MKYKKSLFKLVLAVCLFFLPGLCRAMPPGTLLYRTSGDGKMFGYSQDPLIYSEKGIIKNIYPGHVAIYIGKENGQDYIVEAMSGGVVKNPAEYFVNRSDGETFLGARMPSSVSALQQARVVALAKSLVGKNLGYDFDFHNQKGPGDREWTCVGLTEKLYESANVYNPNNLGALEYDPAYYAVDITPDGFDNSSVVNSSGDCFSREREFSKIARRTDILIPAPEIIGYDVGLEHKGERYIFLPYTQFLQPTLTAVAADVEISSSFSRAEINGPLNVKALVLRWSLINNPLSSLKNIGTAIKETAAQVAAKTKEIAKNLSQKFFNSGTGASLTLIDDDLQSISAGSSTKKVVVVNKATAAEKTTKTTTKAAVDSSTKSSGVGTGASQTTGTKAVVVKTNTSKISASKTNTPATAKASTTVAASQVKTVSQTKTASPAYYSPAAPVVSSATVHSGGSGGSSSGGSGGSGGSSSGATVDNYPKLAIINKIYSTGDNDWVELINPTDYDFDLAAASYRLERAKTAVDPSLLFRVGDVDDGTYPGGTIIKAHDTYLIVNGGASDYYKQKADALVIREGFSWPGSGYTLFLSTGAISSSLDPDIVDAVGFGADATYFLGSGPAPEIKDNYILRRASSSDDNVIDFELVLSDDPSIALNTDINDIPETATSTSETATSTSETATSTSETATSTLETATSTNLNESETATSTSETATSTPETATSTDPNESETATSTENIDWGRLLLIQKIYSTGDNDWIELFNPTDNDFDLGIAGYRLEKSVSTQDPNILMRFGDAGDGFYPGSTVIKAHDSYLIARDDASNYYLDQADAIATRTEFVWDGNGYSFYLGSDVISSSTDPDIIDLVGFGPAAL
ncbi:MAG: YiiX/YebB-like N1pC/P60 family cysteine hydrolase, partial [bacterium]|nr:YiiX/YebB-like N1pC/P60 family cysteine hydrolase [bacterium]